MLNNHVKCGSCKWNNDEVVVEKPRKKHDKQTYIQTNKQTYKHTDEVI